MKRTKPAKAKPKGSARAMAHVVATSAMAEKPTRITIASARPKLTAKPRASKAVYTHAWMPGGAHVILRHEGKAKGGVAVMRLEPLGGVDSDEAALSRAADHVCAHLAEKN